MFKIVLLFLMVPCFCKAQNVITRNQLETSHWMTSIKDSAFFFSDTISLLQESEGIQADWQKYFDSDTYIEMRFFNHHKLYFATIEEKTETSFTLKGKYTWAIKKKGTILTFKYSNKIIGEFEFLSKVPLKILCRGSLKPINATKITLRRLYR